MALGHARGVVNVRVRGWLERPGRLGTQGVGLGSRKSVQMNYVRECAPQTLLIPVLPLTRRGSVCYSLVTLNVCVASLHMFPHRAVTSF